jgi:hypothetical protein
MVNKVPGGGRGDGEIVITCLARLSSAVLNSDPDIIHSE